jgi:hypothetical protein
MNLSLLALGALGERSVLDGLEMLKGAAGRAFIIVGWHEILISL